MLLSLNIVIILLLFIEPIYSTPIIVLNTILALFTLINPQKFIGVNKNLHHPVLTSGLNFLSTLVIFSLIFFLWNIWVLAIWTLVVIANFQIFNGTRRGGSH